MPTLFNPFYRAIDANGNPMLSAQLYFYTQGTTNPANTYSDVSLTAANANPVIADAGGLFGAIYLDNSTTYKAILKDANGSTIQTLDPISSLTPTSISAALGYSPANSAGSATSYLAADVPMSVTGVYVNGPSTGSIGGAGQKWLIVAKAGVNDASTAATFVIQIHDGSGVIDTAGGATGGAGFGMTLICGKVVTLSAATNFTLRGTDLGSASGGFNSSNDGGTTRFATSITAVRLS